ncbi:MAG TPA: MFS transporter [Trebonia sp.]|jgi:MFS family permease|nr:MFS transporter [Trebonia sp.]
MTNTTEVLSPAATSSRPAARGPRPGVVLAIVLTGQLMAVLDATIVNVAAPSIHADLHASGAGLQLIVAGYTIAYAVLLVTGARLGDILGHRRMFLSGVILFTLASLGCGLAPSTGVLIGLRFVQGVGAATMIPQVLSLLQRTYTSPGPRARAMSLYAAVISGGAVLGQVVGGLLISANIADSTWRPVFLVNVPVGIAVLSFARKLPSGRFDGPRSLDLPGLLTLTPAVLAFVLPLVLGQPLGWPAWGWALLAASVVGFGALRFVERRVAARGGQPILPRALLGLPGMATGIAGLFALMTGFGGWLFGFALQLQDGLGDSALHAGLTFAPAAVAFALVSLNWQRVPARYQAQLIMSGFVLNGAGLLGVGLLLGSGGNGGVLVYVVAAIAGGGMAAAFGPLMTRVLSRVPVAIAADASGVIVTVNQLGIVVGVATFGSLYLNLAGKLPAHVSAAFALSSAHAYQTTSVALAGLAVVGMVLALGHVRSSRLGA